MSFEFKENIMCPTDPTGTPERIEQYKAYYPIKYNICKSHEPKRIAEIGVRAGYSAWTFLQACPDARYIGYDANNGQHGGKGGEDGSFTRWAHTILVGYNYILIHLDTQKVSDLNLRDIDFFHVDGDHTEKGVQHDLHLAFRAVNKGGLILVDDYQYLKSVHTGVNAWLAKEARNIRFQFMDSLRGEVLIWKL